MNIKEWHQAFKVQLDTLDTESALRLQPEVVDVFFNKAINKIIQDAYEGFESTQKLSDVLSSQTKLIKYPSTDFPTVINNFNDNLYGFNLPDDYYFHLQSNATIDISGQIGNVRTVRHTLDTESKVISNPFERSDDTEIAIFFKLSQIQFYLPKNSNLIEFDMIYLKKPVQVSYKQYVSSNGANGNSDLHPALHEQVINLAVIYALETYGSERTPSKVQIKDVT
jgi:hypothetical protein